MLIEDIGLTNFCRDDKIRYARHIGTTLMNGNVNTYSKLERSALADKYDAKNKMATVKHPCVIRISAWQ